MKTLNSVHVCLLKDQPDKRKENGILFYNEPIFKEITSAEFFFLNGDFYQVGFLYNLLKVTGE